MFPAPRSPRRCVRPPSFDALAARCSSRAGPAASTTPSWRCARPSSASVSRGNDLIGGETVPKQREPVAARSAGSPRPAWRRRRREAPAHGTTDPTARYFDCVATPHCPASRSHATIEYVATTGSVIRERGQVEVEQVAALGRNEHARRPPGAASASFTPSGGIGACHHRPSRSVRLVGAPSGRRPRSTEHVVRQSSSPSTAISGTRCPVAPSQRSLSSSDGLTPRLRRDQLDAGRELAQLLVRPLQEREGASSGTARSA